MECGLELDETLKVIKCVTCKFALHPTVDTVSKHLKSVHSMPKKAVKSALPAITEAINRFPLASPTEVRYQPSGRAPIQGIKVHTGFHCPVKQSNGTPCPYVGGNVETLYQHLGKRHKDHPQRPAKYRLEDYRCDYQTLFIGKNRHFFRVRTGLTDIHHRSPYSLFLNTTDLAPVPNEQPERIKDNEIPSFIRRTRWHTFLGDYRKNPKDVVGLIEYPVATYGTELGKVLRRLENVSNAWMKKVHAYWKDASEYVRRILAHYPM